MKKNLDFYRKFKAGIRFALLFALCSDQLYAATTEQLLTQILAKTTQILTTINRELPQVPIAINQLFVAIQSPDKDDKGHGSGIIADTQANYTAYGNLIIDNINNAKTSANSFDQYILNYDPAKAYKTSANLPTNANANATFKKIPNANDITYSSVLKTPVFALGKGDNKDDRKLSIDAIIDNYIKNASGAALVHDLPSPSWQKNSAYYSYIALRNMSTAVSSYNTHLLATYLKKGQDFTTAQTTLINQATNSEKWFAKIASENVGEVFRQLLLYQSQIFVLLTQLVQSQQQMVTAQAMTNAMLIGSTQTVEQGLRAQAQS